MVDRKRPFVEKRGDRWRVRWPDRDGNIRSASRDDEGHPFADKAAAERYGWEQMGQIARGQWLDPRKSGITLAEWVNQWWKIARIDELAPKSIRKYRSVIEIHILPAFGDRTLADLQDADAELAAWVTKQHADYASSTAGNRRDLFLTILNDAVATGRMGRNPLATPRRRGRRPTRSGRAPEKAWATPLQTLLIAERSAIYAQGDPTTFILWITLAYTGMRIREAIGLERRHLHKSRLDVEWQLVEHPGHLARERPKHGSRRTIDLPPFLSDLLQVELREHTGVCECGHEGGPYVFGGSPRRPQHLNSSLTNNRFRAAAGSVYYSIPKKKYVPIPIIGEPFPGQPTHGHRAEDACWAPILPGATPHSLRHSHRVWMDDDGIPEVLKHERLGHQMTGMSATYSHVSPDARRRLVEALTARWEQSLRQRVAIHPYSPLPLLDDFLRPIRESKETLCSQECSQDASVVAFNRPA